MPYQDDREESIFRCIVESYIETASPVGSRAVSKHYGGSLSPASIRNVMADLEEMGLIQHPHTSAGRIPTARGYRHYVDNLMCDLEKMETDIPELHEILSQTEDIEDVAEKVSRLLADLTHNAGVFFVKNVKRISVLRDQPIEFGSKRLETTQGYNRLYVDGTSHVFEQPEFSDIHRAQMLLKAIELKEELTSFLDRGLDEEKIHIYIGEEIQCGQLSDFSMVVKQYSLQGRPMGCVGVIGPTRMHYEKTVGVVSRLADTMTEFLNDW